MKQNVVHFFFHAHNKNHTRYKLKQFCFNLRITRYLYLLTVFFLLVIIKLGNARWHEHSSIEDLKFHRKPVHISNIKSKMMYM